MILQELVNALPIQMEELFDLSYQKKYRVYCVNAEEENLYYHYNEDFSISLGYEEWEDKHSIDWIAHLSVAAVSFNNDVVYIGLDS